MLPIKDRYPTVGTPWVVYGLIAVNALVFIVEVSLPDARLQHLIAHFGVIPARVTASLKGEASILTGLAIPAITSMFLHGGWAHLIGNMWYLFIFGDNVEDRLGHGPFLLFYLFCGAVALGFHYVVNVNGILPTIGASGAIAGVLGAYIVTWPRARVLALVPLFFIFTFMELPAAVFLGFWFLLQLFQGSLSIGASFATGGVAYGAHIGGFIAGAALLRAIGKKIRRTRADDYRNRRYYR